MGSWLKLVACACLLPLPLSVHAADWQRSGSVTPQVVYSDNVCLDDGDKRGDFVNSVTPALGVTATGARLRLNASGSAQVSDVRSVTGDCRRRGVGGRADTVVPRGAAGLQSVLVRDLFFFDADARVSQNLINPFRTAGDDGLNRAGNTNTSYNYRVSPYVRTRLPGDLNFEVRYAYDEQINTADAVRDSTRQQYSTYLIQDPQAARLTFGVSASHSEVEFDFPRQERSFVNEFRTAQATANLRLTRSLALNGTVGREWNDFLSVQDDIDGFRWDVGASWVPNERITVAGGYGRRFFGSTPRASIRYRHLRSELSLDWGRTITFNRNFRRGSFDPIDEGSLDDGLEGGLDPDTGEFLPPDAFPTTLTNSPIFAERAAARYRLQGVRSSAGFQLSWTQQERSEDLGSAIFKRATLFADRTLSQHSSLNASVGYNEQRSDRVLGGGGFGRNAETWFAALAYQRTLSQRARMSLRYRYTDRESEFALDTYTENRLTLSLVIDL